MRLYNVSGQLSASPRVTGDQSVLRPGQIVQGKILKLHPNQKAEILIGSRKMTAQMEAALTIGSKYHFQVQAADEVIYLKVINEQTDKDSEVNMKQLLRDLGLKAGKPQLAFIKELTSDKISFTREQLAHAFSHLNQSADKQKARQVLKQMITRNMPMRPDVFQALYTKETETFSGLLKGVLNTFQNAGQDDATAQELVQKIRQLTEQPLNQKGNFLAMSPKEQFLAQLKQTLQITGFSYENAIKRDVLQDQSRSIKSMLIQMVRKESGVQQEASTRLLHFINGLQLNSVNESSYFMQLSLHIPAEKIGLTGDLQLDIEGEKADDGMINPNQCSILFYLNLAHLRETVIDMQIRKRTISLTIYNDHKHIATTIKALKANLTDRLSAFDYHLTAVSVRPLNQKRRSAGNSQDTPPQTHSSQGVDYRI